MKRHVFFLAAGLFGLLLASPPVAEAATVDYCFNVTTFYQFGGCNSNGDICAGPDTGFLSVVNCSASTTFAGTLVLSGTSPGVGGFCPPTGSVADTIVSPAFGPSASLTFALSTDSSNCGGFNNPKGANFSMVGTVTDGVNTDPVSLSVNDRDIHSGVFRTPAGQGTCGAGSPTTDAFVLQGGAADGCDPADDFETSQAPGTFQFAKCPLNFDFDFSDSQYTNCFRDLLNGGEINAGFAVTDLNTALNFTGGAGPAGKTWLTVYDKTPTDPVEGPTFGAETLCADVLIEKWNNVKGAGVVALLNEGAGKKGLALLVYDAGGTDTLSLAVVNPVSGSLTSLAANSLFGGILENAWYRLNMIVNPTGPVITGKVFRHANPADPNSLLGAQVGGTLTYTPVSLPAGVTSPGENGIIANANSALVNSSVTNFTNDPNCATNLIDP